MPVHPGQRRFNLRMLPRRFIVAFGLAFVFSLAVLFLAFTSRVQVPAVPDSLGKLSQSAQHAAESISIPSPTLPALWNPFLSDAHSPPDQANSTHGNTRWYSDLKWLNPFSSLITLDDDRALLPPLSPRTPIYTYYDSGDEDSKAVEAEHDLVLTWRKAWWAKGFQPIVLSRHDAMSNPMFEALQHMDIEKPLTKEFERWLAWEYMGGGILANWLALPMARFDDPLLADLRKADFERLTRFKGLATGLFSGRRDHISDVIRKAMNDKELKKKAAFLDILPRDTFRVDSRQGSIAFYDMPTIKSRYSKIMTQLQNSQVEGLRSLWTLINAHLHVTWQNSYSDGIAILKPHPGHMTVLSSFAIQIAQNLSACPETLIPRSCPPNRPSCKSCDPDHPMKLSTPSTYTNKTSLFTIGTVAHPFTFNSLQNFDNLIDTTFIRRHCKRDQWITSATMKLFRELELSGPQRLVGFKEAVASDAGTAHSLWLTAERHEPLELEWVFGFTNLSPPDSRIGGERDSRIELGAPSQDDLDKEKERIERAEEIVEARRGRDARLREMVEAWNLADTEAWRFVRALGTRRSVERNQWEQKERRYAGSERGTSWLM